MSTYIRRTRVNREKLTKEDASAEFQIISYCGEASLSMMAAIFAERYGRDKRPIQEAPPKPVGTN